MINAATDSEALRSLRTKAKFIGYLYLIPIIGLHIISTHTPCLTFNNFILPVSGLHCGDLCTECLHFGANTATPLRHVSLASIWALFVAIIGTAYMSYTVIKSGDALLILRPKKEQLEFNRYNLLRSILLAVSFLVFYSAPLLGLKTNRTESPKLFIVCNIVEQSSIFFVMFSIVGAVDNAIVIRRLNRDL